MGVWDHFYNNSALDQNTSTHYVNLAYEVEVYERPDLPDEQHIDYKWFSVDELLKSKQVHKYTKDCFKD